MQSRDSLHCVKIVLAAGPYVRLAAKKAAFTVESSEDVKRKFSCEICQLHFSEGGYLFAFTRRRCPKGGYNCSFLVCRDTIRKRAPVILGLHSDTRNGP